MNREPQLTNNPASYQKVVWQAKNRKSEFQQEAKADVSKSHGYY